MFGNRFLGSNEDILLNRQRARNKGPPKLAAYGGNLRKSLTPANDLRSGHSDRKFGEQTAEVARKRERKSAVTQAETKAPEEIELHGAGLVEKRMPSVPALVGEVCRKMH